MKLSSYNLIPAIFLTMLFFLNTPLSFATGECIDNDGDGWGWDGSASCRITNDTDQAVSDIQETAPASDCIDSDGDGWGWDGSASCRITNDTDQAVSESSTSESPIGSDTGTNSQDGITTTPECVDNDGDGWGWDGSASCRVSESPVLSVSGTNPEEASTSDCLDNDGDGWGWDGVQSCRAAPLPEAPSSVPQITETTTPSPNAESPEAPQMASITSCPRKSSGVVLTSSMVPNYSEGKVVECNGPGAPDVGNNFAQYGPNLHIGSFIISSNPWNYKASSYADWYQCIKAEGAGDVKIAWDYDWGNEDDLAPGKMEWDIKGYPEIIFGTKSQGVSSGGCEETGLPVIVDEMPQIKIAYSYNAPIEPLHKGDAGDESAELDMPGPNGEAPGRVSITGGDRNVAFESFFHSSCEIKRGSDENKEFEIMVWVEAGTERRPSGPNDLQTATFTDSSGNEYEIWSKRSDPDYIGYVAKTPILEAQLDWNEFIEDVAANSVKYGAKEFDTSWCLGNILFGTEIWWGKGSFNLKELNISASY